MDKENYIKAIDLGSKVVEGIFNSTEIDDNILAESCYNVAICNRYLGYESYNRTVEVINQGINDKEILSSALIDAEDSIMYFKVANNL